MWFHEWVQGVMCGVHMSFFLFLSLSSSRRASGGRHSSRYLLTTNPSLAFLKTTKTRWICGWRHSLRLCGRTWSLSLKPGAGLSKMMSLKAWPVCQSGRKTSWKCIQLRVQNEVTTEILAGKRPFIGHNRKILMIQQNSSLGTFSPSVVRIILIILCKTDSIRQWFFKLCKIDGSIYCF